MVTCDRCGRVHPQGTPPLTWSAAVEQGRSKLFCEECTRTHLRAMEAKLDSEWW